ncbi:TonB-dependent receptor [Dyadobacter luteus]|uniref:TonB-dependent receptor n=1 Tax=Dyadobacter luteus TaxID=2259619 RepID=A0A3D8YBI6_9BACT|nr:TonB-dependent receptor [Dyadobacter luteus]REA61349.1 TonB-dependent receptor [Dyadobacter luteus]
MKLIYSTICILFLLVAHHTTSAQRGQVSGRIISSDNQPIPDASIVIKNTSYGALSDSDGNFKLSLPTGNYTIGVSQMGFQEKTQQIQISTGSTTSLNDITLTELPLFLSDAVVTGQFEKQSLRNSVYQVRSIDGERIKLRGATTIQSVLNTELGIRFSNDPILGTTDIQLMGMSGQNVKILLDGVPMVDRGGTRESLGQIDVNIIERIEIVEGPMSVIYGTDALAGVINIITKKGGGQDNLSVSARVLEETVGTEYNAFNNDGTHQANVGIAWQKSGFRASGNVTRNNFGGWQGDLTGRAKMWLPKEQMLFNGMLGYSGKNWNAWYQFNGTDETIKLLGNATSINQAGDKDYITKRWFHQAQGEYRASDKLDFSGALSYTDYSRRTLSTNIDLNTGRRTLSLDPAGQDKSIFTTTFFRGMAKYKVSSNVILLPGIEITNNSSSGQRIKGEPTINEYAFFVSSELKLPVGIKLSPGVRFLKNSIYDAPPIIPSLNAKVSLSKSFDLRLGYARGFRSPALRELYFDFHDASHSINGNENLKAEYSNSFNSFLVWNAPQKNNIHFTSTLGAFYNVFHDRIDTALDPDNPTQTTYLNISLFKTTGFSLDNKFSRKHLQASLGANYIGSYNEILDNAEGLGDLPQFIWSPEVNANLVYLFSKINTSISFFYKYTGKRPRYMLTTTDPVTATLGQINSYHLADLTITKNFRKYISLTAGAKNLFNLTSINSNILSSGHDATGPGFSGRSYFLGLNFRWSKN